MPRCGTRNDETHLDETGLPRPTIGRGNERRDAETRRTQRGFAFSALSAPLRLCVLPPPQAEFRGKGAKRTQSRQERSGSRLCLCASAPLRSSPPPCLEDRTHLGRTQCRKGARAQRPNPKSKIQNPKSLVGVRAASKLLVITPMFNRLPFRTKG